MLTIAAEDLDTLAVWSVGIALQHATVAPGCLVPCLSRLVPHLGSSALHKLEAVIREDAWKAGDRSGDWHGLTAEIRQEVLRRRTMPQIVVEDDGGPD